MASVLGRVQVRMKKAYKELYRGNKVRIVIAFKGRENESMVDIAEGLCTSIYEHVSEFANWEQEPTLNGRTMTAYLTPKPQN